MSLQAIAWAIECQDLPRDERTGRLLSSAKLVLMALANHADRDGSDCFPSIDTITHYTGLSERAVQYALRALEEHRTIAKTADPLVRASTIGRVDRRPQSYDLVGFLRDVQRPPNAVQDRKPRGAKSKIESPDTGCKVSGDLAPEPVLNLQSKEEPKTSSSTVADAPADQESNPSPEPGAKPRQDVQQLCTTLRDAMIANGCKPPTITQGWRDSARLLLDRDGRSLHEALDLLAWSQADEFWRSNIQSLPTFRKQYDRLRLRWQQDGPVRYLRSPEAIREWLREQWRLGRVRAIEERAGLRYPLPDLPAGVTTVEAAKAFHAEAIRAWITEHHTQIVEAIARREQPEASAS